MSDFLNYRDYADSRKDKFYKTTLFHGDMLMVGLNCLEPGQMQAVHEHADQDKVYVVMEGNGRFTVGDVVQEAGQGGIVWAAAGVPHGVENIDEFERLVILVCIAPPPAKS